MDTASLLLACAAALAVGIASFFFYFHIGEHHMYGLLYLQLFSTLCLAGVLALVNLQSTSLLTAVSIVARIAGSWLVGVYGSCLIWRIFFNPLNKIPGPWLARVTKLYSCYLFRNKNAYIIIDALHAKYGPYLRLGPNDLSIINADAIPLAYGPQTTVTKAAWYDTGAPHHSMHTARSQAVHDHRRRFWAPAFSDKALREYETIINAFNMKFMQRMEEFRSTPVDVCKWFNLYSFDVMGRLAFGKEYNMLDSGKRHWALDLLTEGMEAGAIQPPMWLLRLLITVPGLASGFNRFMQFCVDELAWRVQHGEGKVDTPNDITGWILKAYKDHPHPEKDVFLQGDARLIIVAGSDTTAAVLTFLFYELATHPDEVEKLRKELRPLTKGGNWTDKDIQNANHLNAVIYEALRLHAVVPSGVTRKTAPQGFQIGETFIPGNVQFVIPQYSVGRDEANYTDALSFIPERWYSRPEMIKHADAFAPFSLGPFNCIGKNLARTEMRTLITHLILKYDVKLAPGEDGHRLMNESHDHFTMTLGKCELVFTPART